MIGVRSSKGASAEVEERRASSSSSSTFSWSPSARSPSSGTANGGTAAAEATFSIFLTANNFALFLRWRHASAALEDAVVEESSDAHSRFYLIGSFKKTRT